MAGRGHRVALLGSTGAVGQELLAVLEERSFPVLELLPYGSEASAGTEIEFGGETLEVEPLLPGGGTSVDGWDLVLCAAPGILEELLPELEAGEARVVDVSGSLELSPEVPLHRVGSAALPAGSRRIAVPRGAVAGMGLALEPLEREVGLVRVSAVTLESASGAGREGVGELADQTVQLLSAMTGEAGDAVRFPQPLAFDCLPSVGLLLEEGETSEEARLRMVVRRLLERPELPIEVTRVRVPIFAGSLTLAASSGRRASRSSCSRPRSCRRRAPAAASTGSRSAAFASRGRVWPSLWHWTTSGSALRSPPWRPPRR
jgi:aspartate-semialdehyde dehydrogenase